MTNSEPAPFVAFARQQTVGEDDIRECLRFIADLARSGDLDYEYQMVERRARQRSGRIFARAAERLAEDPSITDYVTLLEETTRELDETQDVVSDVIFVHALDRIRAAMPARPASK